MYYLLNPETKEVRCVTSLGDEQKLKTEGWISISGDHFTMIDNIAQIGKLTTQRDKLLEALEEVTSLFPENWNNKGSIFVDRANALIKELKP